MRRLLLLTSAIVLVDMAFYAAIAPLLPVYADRYGLSKTGAGVLAGSYAAGTLAAALPSGWLAARIGARRVVVLGLALMALASLGFAFGNSVALLDAMRFLQGVGAACTWAGGLGWLLSCTPVERRGQTIGIAMSAALGGLLLGPVLGAVARGVGPEAPFSAVAVLAVLLIGASLRAPAPAEPSEREPRPFVRALRDARVLVGMRLMGVAALAFGAIDVLTPLALDRLGATGAGIAATFVVASAVEAVSQLLAGRAADRVGRLAPIRISLAALVVLLVLLPLPGTALGLGAVIVIGCSLGGTLSTASQTVLSDGIEGAGLDQVFAFALVNLTWAGGQVIGTIGGGALARATSDAVPYVLLAGVCAAALVGVLRGGRALPAPSRVA